MYYNVAKEGSNCQYMGNCAVKLYHDMHTFGNPWGTQGIAEIPLAVTETC